MVPYAGPPPPSGVVQWMFCVGSLMSHALQCTQFCALMCRLFLPLPSSASTYSYTPAGQKRASGPAYTGRLTTSGMPGLRSRRCTGWSWSCSVPERNTLVVRSKVTSPSGLGYSMGLWLAAGSVASWSGLLRKVQGDSSSGFMMYVSRAALSRPGSSPQWKPGLMLRSQNSSFATHDSLTLVSYCSTSTTPSGSFASSAKTASAASMPVFIAVCVPLILGTLTKPAEQPISAPPGKLSLGMDW
mmetsp:Transcript_25610/g.65927  ORF Transcript_25610/g.65927 Transcript_25610/m.65927 type:complete len:243 (-) Transcript_25610:1255-1983(-)